MLGITIFRGLDAGAALARGLSRGQGMEKGADETHHHCDGLGTRIGFIDVKRGKKTNVAHFLIASPSCYSRHKAW